MTATAVWPVVSFGSTSISFTRPVVGGKSTSVHNVPLLAVTKILLADANVPPVAAYMVWVAFGATATVSTQLIVDEQEPPLPTVLMNPPLPGVLMKLQLPAELVDRKST